MAKTGSISTTKIAWLAAAAGVLYCVHKKIKGASGIGGVVTATGNEKVTIREAHKRRKEFLDYVIFKDIEYPKENQVWEIDYYDPAYKEYVLHNCADMSKEKYVKGDKTCYVGFNY